MTVIPSKRHRPVGQETGQTNPIERLNNTFRQRISRLVRESLSFSKKMANHVGEPFGILSITTTESSPLAGVCSQSSTPIPGISRSSFSSISLKLPDFVPPLNGYVNFCKKNIVSILLYS